MEPAVVRLNPTVPGVESKPDWHAWHGRPLDLNMHLNIRIALMPVGLEKK
jgi:hypothetical protein